MFRRIILLLLVIALLGSACGKAAVDEEKGVRQYTLTDLDKRVVEASNSFGMRLYREISRANPNMNVFISPLSISSALSMVYNGASGTTLEEMAKSLGLDGMTKKESGHGYRVALDLLTHPADEEIGLTVANSLWMRKGKTFHETFVQQSRDDYAAEVSELIFSSPNAARTMNRWVKNRTNGKIPDIVDNVKPQSVMYVLNAVYFEGKWTEPFLPDSTTSGEFQTLASETVPVKMMARGGQYEYVQADGYQAIRMPFGKKASVSMVILLPDEVEGIVSLQEMLAEDTTRLTKPFEKRPGRVELPRVHIEYEASLKESLRTIGMKEAFIPIRADFSSIAPTPPNLFINNVTHKTFLEITEQGTVAAAATTVEMLAGSAPAEAPFHMIMNRPFVLAIVDHDTDSILFVGTIMNPNG
ncbi:serpin family protein [Cohnella sp.]|uniref:serpin family protein n=1 Tax=Cohnella sp. TaxID=1883426 RepID=UPI00356832FF